jgi:citrate lyase subunit beta/citryl-CoA lyase
MRSWLYVPGNRPDRFAKAAASGADAIILDLEDAVPHAEKDAARAAVVAWLGHAETSCLVTARINRGSRSDLEAVVRPGLHGVQLPKVESADECAPSTVARRTRGGRRAPRRIDPALPPHRVRRGGPAGV